MEPRKEQGKDASEAPKDVEKQRPRFRPQVERLEERVVPSGSPFFFRPGSSWHPGHPRG